ncbi:hypothetical protein DENSPDRAFT_436848 [Dentipellis sp. KUC8613]|nr:hypothetical protein DENSPDRAFT_436848 [Dentipellis sp. KUC8613]
MTRHPQSPRVTLRVYKALDDIKCGCPRRRAPMCGTDSKIFIQGDMTFGERPARVKDNSDREVLRRVGGVPLYKLAEISCKVGGQRWPWERCRRSEARGKDSAVGILALEDHVDTAEIT